MKEFGFAMFGLLLFCNEFKFLDFPFGRTEELGRTEENEKKNSV